MIPEQKASHHTAYNHSRVSMGVSGCPILHSSNAAKPCRNMSTSCSAHKNEDYNAEFDTLKSFSCNYNNGLDAMFEAHLLSNEKRLSIEKMNVLGQRKTGRTVDIHKPAEVFRKDLISAMKIPDTSSLPSEEYWVMQDSWKIEWEKGVQVPVNYEAIPEKSIRKLSKDVYKDFKLPRKMLRLKPKPGDKTAVDLCLLAESICQYDLDELDLHWLEELNVQRKLMGLEPLFEYSMEQIMEALENQCYDNMQPAVRRKEGAGMQYDEDVVCDVCRQPESEEGNEMVFCDGCNVCVHQACYGILKIPEGSWLCKPCSLGMRDSIECVLCGQKGGAMKSTRSGQTWAHVICALWIPEISFADANRMEPITKVSNVPAERWALLCSLCKERVGACVQCSIKQCVTAYHVTCAVEARLDMSTEFDVSCEEGDSVVFKSFCKKHSKNRKESSDLACGATETGVEKSELRRTRAGEHNDEFYASVSLPEIESSLNLPGDVVSQVASYWRLKRRAGFNKPLMLAKNAEASSAAEAAETNLKRRLRLFTHIRQDLERVRNLCYMMCRREKLKSAGVANMENVFLTQMKSLEYRMKIGYHTPRMLSLLQKSGDAKACEVARKESTFLAKSKYWCRDETPGAQKPLKPILKMNKRKSPKTANNARTLSISSDDSMVSFKSHSSDEENKQKVDAKPKMDVQCPPKRRRGRPPLNKNLKRANLPPKKRCVSVGSFDSETENRKPPEPVVAEKKARLATRRQLYEGNFALSIENDKIRTRQTHSRVLSDSFPVNHSVKSKSKPLSADETADKRSPSPRAYRNVSSLKRQIRLRRKSAPSCFNAKRYHCYVLY